MSTVQELVSVWKELGLDGEDLRKFIKEQQALEREKRLKEREARGKEKRIRTARLLVAVEFNAILDTI